MGLHLFSIPGTNRDSVVVVHCASLLFVQVGVGDEKRNGETRLFLADGSKGGRNPAVPRLVDNIHS
jgi:hypothetical protein